MARSLCMTFLLALLSMGIPVARADPATLISIPTPRGATQTFILIKPDHPVAAIILFAGGSGVLGLKTGEFRYGNFLGA